MPFTVDMPKLSPTMEEGTIAKWHKKQGDHVESGDLLLEIATDKATMEFNALDEGYLRKILIEEGKIASVNDPIAIFTESKDESIEGFELPKKQEPAEQQKEPAESESKQEVSAVKAASISQPQFVPAPPLEGVRLEDPLGKILASPLAKKLAKQKGIDLSTVRGSGPNGRIMERDLDLAQPDALVAFGRQETPDIDSGSYEEMPLTPMRKVVGKRLQESKSFIPHFYVHQTVDAQSLFDTREQLKQNGLKVTYNDFVIRACALALKQHPHINSGYNSVNEAIIRFHTVDISMAVTVEGGLITPIIRYADHKNLGQLSQEAKYLGKKAKEGKLEPQEYTGGSFTVSNLGMFGVSDFVAVINPPQAAILAVGGIEDVPVVKDGKIEVGKTLKLTLSVDHRVIDGSDAAKFIKTVQMFLERPSLLLVN